MAKNQVTLRYDSPPSERYGRTVALCRADGQGSVHVLGVPETALTTRC